MKELLVRVLSGLLYISIILFSMYAAQEWFLLLFFILGSITLREYIKLVELKSKFWHYASYLFLAFWIYYFNYLYDRSLLTYVLLAVVLGLNLNLIRELFGPQPVTNLEHQGKAGLLYVIGGFLFLTLIPARESGFIPDLIGAVFVLVWANDSFAYLVGKTIGKHKLFPAVSPKKTWEGFIGGMTGSVGAALLIHHYLDIYPWGVCVAIAVIVSVMGTMGDLIESRFKRVAGVKDSGRLMPGHGGIYDRLDSIVFASPFVYSFLEIIDHVS
jgi:phosphatidate cytidylyltransferase